MDRARPAGSVDLGASGLFGARPEPFDKAQASAGREDEKQLTDHLVALVREHGRLDYRKLVALLGSTSGWVVNDKRVERIWWQEGLKVPTPAAEAEPGLADRWACARRRAERPNNV